MRRAALLSYMSGFAALGFGVRCYQLALMKRNIFQSQSARANFQERIEGDSQAD